MNSSVTLKELILDSCNIDDEAVTAVCEFLSVSSTLTILQLQRNPIALRGAEQLAIAIKSNKYIENINLIGCSQIGREGIDRLLQSLNVNQSIQFLFLPKVYESVDSEWQSTCTRVAWLPDEVLGNVVDLSWTHISAKALGK